MPPTWEDLAWSPLENLQKRQKIVIFQFAQGNLETVVCSMQ